MQIYIGSARIGENGSITGGKPGDQKQTSKAGAADYKGEVSEQVYYKHSKNWDVVRAIDPQVASLLAANMMGACSNPKIGYNQNQRYQVVTQAKEIVKDIVEKSKKYVKVTDREAYLKKNLSTVLSSVSVAVNSDCSALVRACTIAALAGTDPGDFTTYNAVSALLATKRFKKVGTIKTVTDPMQLYCGDILCTSTKGHIVIVTRGPEPVITLSSKSAASVKYYKACGAHYNSFVDALKSIGVNSAMTNRKKIAELNGIISYSGEAEDNEALLLLLKRGKLIKSKG